MEEKTREQDLSQLIVEVRGHFASLTERVDELSRNFRRGVQDTLEIIEDISYQLGKQGYRRD